MAGEVPQEAHAARVVLGGGIGAGKSTVAELFGDHGFGLIIADEVGREVLSPGTKAVDQVARRWPRAVVDGVVDRAALAQIVFADESELDALEAITHPYISQRISDGLVAAGDRPMLVEVPVLSVASRFAAVRIAVVADSEVRIARAVQRGNEVEDVRRRVAAQPTDAEWIEWADRVIDNSGSWAETERVVLSIIEEMDTDG
ncbi:MAG: dephospho-CoA kinase [Acidimicrobiia bacterium]